MDSVIRIEWSNIKEDTVKKTPIEQEKVAEEIKKAPETKKPSTKSNDMMNMLKMAGLTYGIGRQAAQMGVNYVSQQYILSGNTLKAERLNTQFQNATNNIGLGLGVVGSIATGNPLVIAMTAYALGQRAFNLALQTQKYQAQLTIDKYNSQYYSNRLVKDISEVR